MTDEPRDDEPKPAEPPAIRASDADRERVAAALNDALAEGRISVSELEERLDTLYSAKTVDELEPLTADLPNAATTAVARPLPKDVQETHHLIGGTPGSASSVAVMSGTDRKGNWVVPAQHNSFAFWGGVELDLRRARFAEQHCTITATAVMGGIDVIVPDDIQVEVTGMGFMGAFESEGDAPTETDPNGPVLRVNGFAFWGAVTVKRKPREIPKDKHRMI